MTDRKSLGFIFAVNGASYDSEIHPTIESARAAAANYIASGKTGAVQVWEYFSDRTHEHRPVTADSDATTVGEWEHFVG